MVIACVGGGSNAIGAFAEFIPDKNVKLVGVEAAGKEQILIDMLQLLHWELLEYQMV